MTFLVSFPPFTTTQTLLFISWTVVLHCYSFHRTHKNKNTENNTNTILSSNTMNLTASYSRQRLLTEEGSQHKFIHLLVQKSTGTCDILHQHRSFEQSNTTPLTASQIALLVDSHLRAILLNSSLPCLIFCILHFQSYRLMYKRLTSEQPKFIIAHSSVVVGAKAPL